MLCECRVRLAEGDRADQLLQLMLDRLVAAGLLSAPGRGYDTGSESAGAAGESVRAALKEIAEADLDWLVPLDEPEWAER
jgi:hypothetical protein